MNIQGDEVRRVKTRGHDSWDVYLQQVIYNDQGIYFDDGTLQKKKSMRSFLPDPSFPFIHIPEEDFEKFKELFILTNQDHPQSYLIDCDQSND